MSGPRPEVIVKREKESAVEDARITEMRIRQAAGEDVPPKIVLQDDEIEGDKPKVEGKDKEKKTSSIKEKAAKKKAK
jgi:hypothetical protein